MGSEEMAYLNTKKILEQQMIDYYRQMFKRGYISTEEVKFLKQGIVFRYLKVVELNMRPDILTEREHYMETGQFHKLYRDNSEDPYKSRTAENDGKLDEFVPN